MASGSRRSAREDDAEASWSDAAIGQEEPEEEEKEEEEEGRVCE